MLYPAELRRHMPQTLDFTGVLGFSPDGHILDYQLFYKLSITDFFALVTSEHSPKWGKPNCHFSSIQNEIEL